MTQITFTAEPAGDGECFCFKVSKEEYIKILGEETYNNDLKMVEEQEKEMKEECSSEEYKRYIEEKKNFSDDYRIYPSHFFFDSYGKPVKITLTIEKE
jgi:hypothetical protein